MTDPLDTRRQILGDAYVDQAVAHRDELDGRFQRLITENVWGDVWSDRRMAHRDRSLINLAVLAVLNRGHEFELHVAAAIRNGVTVTEIQETMIQVAAYAGFPAAVDGLRRARTVLEAEGIEIGPDTTAAPQRHDQAEDDDGRTQQGRH